MGRLCWAKGVVWDDSRPCAGWRVWCGGGLDSNGGRECERDVTAVCALAPAPVMMLRLDMGGVTVRCWRWR